MGTPASPGSRSRPRTTTTDRPHLHLHIPVMAGTDAAGTFHHQRIPFTPRLPQTTSCIPHQTRAVRTPPISVGARTRVDSSAWSELHVCAVRSQYNEKDKTRKRKRTSTIQALIPNLVDHGFHLLSLSKEAYPSTNTGVFSFPPTATSTPDPNTHLSKHAHRS